MQGSKRRPEMVCENQECKVTYCFVHRSVSFSTGLARLTVRLLCRSAAHPGETCTQYLKRNRDNFKRDDDAVKRDTIAWFVRCFSRLLAFLTVVCCAALASAAALASSRNLAGTHACCIIACCVLTVLCGPFGCQQSHDLFQGLCC